MDGQHTLRAEMQDIQGPDKAGTVCYRVTTELYIGYRRGVIGSDGVALHAFTFTSGVMPESHRGPANQAYSRRTDGTMARWNFDRTFETCRTFRRPACSFAISPRC